MQARNANDLTASGSTATKNETHMELLADRELVIERTFNAPARIVFEAWTKADLVRRWWAPKSHHVEVVECTADVREGGKYRYVLQQGKNEPFAFSGTYTKVAPHTHLVYTQSFEPMAHMGEVIVEITFEARGDKTHLRSHEIYPSKEAREGAISAGMEHGMRETMEQLEALLPSLR